MRFSAGWAPVPRLWFSDSKDNPFHASRSLKIREFAVYLFEAANIAHYDGLDRGYLRCDQSELAKRFRVCRRTIQKWLIWLEKRGFILLCAKVARSKAVKTVLHIVSYPVRGDKGSMRNEPSIIKSKREEKKSPPTPSRGLRFNSQRAYRVSNLLMRTVVGNAAVSDEISAEKACGSPEAIALVTGRFGSFEAMLRMLGKLKRDRRPGCPRAYFRTVLRNELEQYKPPILLNV